MKKLILPLMFAVTLITSQAQAFWSIGLSVRSHPNLRTQVKYYDEMESVAALSAIIIWLKTVTAGASAAGPTGCLLFLLDVNATDGTSEKALVKAVPELSNNPEITQELIKLAKEGKTETIETEDGMTEVNYIEDSTLNPYLSQTGLSNESIQKLKLIFSKNTVQ